MYDRQEEASAIFAKLRPWDSSPIPYVVHKYNTLYTEELVEESRKTRPYSSVVSKLSSL
jgi:hypothetical protein